MDFERDEYYALEGGQLNAIREITKRLFNDCEALKVGERRDMANRLFVILRDAHENKINID